MLLNDRDIRKLCCNDLFKPNGKPMIDPFSDPVSGNGIISYGLTSAGYDLRLADGVEVFNNAHGLPIDPKRFNDPEYRKKMFIRVEFGQDAFAIAGSACIGHNGFPVTIPAHGYILGRSYEYLRIPRHLKARCVGKSTLARCGIIVNTTPLEPEWEGHLTIEISNSSPCPAIVYVMEGIAQLEFETLTGEPETSYKDKGGVYMNSIGVNPARVKP